MLPKGRDIDMIWVDWVDRVLLAVATDAATVSIGTVAAPVRKAEEL